ncbi:biotin transporter BioY [Desulfovibrio aminophilus]|uniref:biotin transporter BioY n=1 Tax=Desulfovibrio aminophilus TaxID=81425 RepID=UPI00040A5EC3|nr:biotin transporter BioY [Desulfovibrio aminophilus]
MNPLAPLHRLVWTALLAAAVAAGAWIVVPIGPVPVSLQPLFVFLAGYALGPRRGALCILLYILAGVIGLPVFAGGRSGPAQLLGPTGGYLLGFVLSAWITGLATGGHGRALTWVRGLGFGIPALIAAYVPGVFWLRHVLDTDWTRALALGLAPFLPWDCLKIVAAVACYRLLSRCRLLPGNGDAAPPGGGSCPRTG